MLKLEIISSSSSSCPVVMIVPWAIHGGFDTALMIAELWSEDPLNVLGPVFAFIVYVCGIVYARYLYIETDAMLPPADKTIHDMLLSSNVRLESNFAVVSVLLLNFS